MDKSKACLVALGSYLPEKVLSNQDLEKMVETSDEWITTRTGMKERRIAAADQAASHLGIEAAKRALAKTALSVDEIDLILCATSTPDFLLPSTAALIQAAIGAKNAAAMDLQAACTGFLYALSVAKAYIESKMAKNVLLIASEKMSSFIDYKDRNTCVLFGDGASAAIVSAANEGLMIDRILIGADGTLSDLIMIPAGGSRHPATAETVKAREHYFKMSGKEVFRHAVRRMCQSSEECMQQSGLQPSDIKWFVPHQANDRILEAVTKGLKIPQERAFRTVHKYGNTSAPSCAIALDELISEEHLVSGEAILLAAFGAGLTWGAATLKQI